MGKMLRLAPDHFAFESHKSHRARRAIGSAKADPIRATPQSVTYPCACVAPAFHPPYRLGRLLLRQTMERP
jgi:hypothetical protein